MNKPKYEEIARLKGSFSELEKAEKISSSLNPDEFWYEYERLAKKDENYKKIKEAYDEKVQQIINKYDKDGKLIKDPFYNNLSEYLREKHSKQVNWDPYNPGNAKPVDGNQEEEPYMYIQEGEISIPIYLDEIGNKILNEVRESKEGKAYSKIEEELHNKAHKNLVGLSYDEFDKIFEAKNDYESLSFLGKAIVKMKEKKLSAKQADQDNSMKL